jgi:hypothetical protein
VAGIRTPEDLVGLRGQSPHLYDELLKVFDLLETHYRDMQGELPPLPPSLPSYPPSFLPPNIHTTVT